MQVFSLFLCGFGGGAGSFVNIFISRVVQQRFALLWGRGVYGLYNCKSKKVRRGRRRHSRECLTPGTRGLGRTGAKKIYHRRCVIHIHLELGECGKKYAVWARRGTAQRAQRTHRSPMAGTRQAEHALISARHTVRQHSRSDGLVFAARVRGGGLTGGRGDSRAWCAFWLAPRSFELATDPVAVCLPAP